MVKARYAGDILSSCAITWKDPTKDRTVVEVLLGSAPFVAVQADFWKSNDPADGLYGRDSGESLSNER